MAKINYKQISIIAILLISLFAVSSYLNLFSIIGGSTEVITNTKSIELKLNPPTFNNYVQTRPVYGGCYTTQAYPYEAYNGAYSQPLYWVGAERKLIGNFCTEEPILKVHSASANVYFEDWFGSGRYPPIYLGTTDNSELSNQNTSLTGRYTVFLGTSYPTRDIGLNADILTETTIGKKCFDIYAIGGYYKCNVASGMDATINYIDINYDAVECSIDIDCNDNRVDTIDSCFEYTCNNIDKTIVDKSIFKSILIGGGISFIIIGTILLLVIGGLFIFIKYGKKKR